MRTAIFIVLAFLMSPAHAQFGIGLSPASMCPNQFGPANGSVNGRDELSNLAGQLAARNNRIDQLKAKEERLDDYIARAKEDIGQVVTQQGFAAIREHRERNNSYGSYRQSCGGGGGGGRLNDTASAGSQTTDVELFSTGGQGRSVDVNQTQVAPPPVYCVTNPATGQRENMWEKFVEDDGTVSDKLCDFRIAGVTRGASAEGRDRCHEGMHEYYDRMAEREKIHDEIARLDREARALEHRLERVRDEITEGTYCPWCAAQRRGYSTMGTGNSMMQGVGLLAMLSLSLGRQQPMMGPRPPMFGGPMMPPPFAGPGYPIRPYPAQIPGYYNVMPGAMPGMGTYGGIPGGMGPGGFGCQGTNPMAFNSPYGSPMLPSVFGGQSPFNNPYANPAMMPMFNQGAGPGWGFPMYGNGMPGFMDPYGLGGGMNPLMLGQQNPFGMNPFDMNNPFGMNNPYGMNPYAMNPYGMNPYGQGPFGFNPYDPYGSNPYGMNPYGMGPYGMNPYGMGPFGASPFGYNPYGAGPFNPYGGANPFNPYGGGYSPFGGPFGPGGGYGSPYYSGMLPPGGIPNYGYQSPYGMPLGSPTGVFLNQIGYLTNRVQQIQYGSYYGGGAGAPSVLPYMGSPVYNTPGTMNNPLPTRTNAPAVLPYFH